MASSTRDGEPRDGEIRLWREDDRWIARDVETGVTTQGASREDALANLDEAVALHNGEIGHEPTDDELGALGIDPTDNTTGDEEPPDVLR
jgi:predicted RNase H-like HicB family nuclease